jgi:hypothetical protein
MFIFKPDTFRHSNAAGAGPKPGKMQTGGKENRRIKTMKKDYTKFMNWAVVTMIDRSTQDAHKNKVNIAALFANPVVAEDSLIPNLPNPEIKRYLLRVDDLERFEEFYNFIQDLNEEHGEKAIYHLKDGNFSVDEENRFRSILNIWTDTKIK